MSAQSTQCIETGVIVHHRPECIEWYATIMRPPLLFYIVRGEYRFDSEYLPHPNEVGDHIQIGSIYEIKVIL